MNELGTAALAEAYEQLRHHALTALPGGVRSGLAVLLREGVAAWIEHCSAGAPWASPHGPDTVSCSAMLPLHAGMVQILASIALNRIREMRP